MTCISIAALRTIIFYILLSIWTLVWGTTSFITLPLVRRERWHFHIAKIWAHGALFLCHLICGIRWQITGRKNIPEQACVVAANHQSSLETYLLQTLFTPQATVLKRELLNIPVFGWVIRQIHPIAINRKHKRKAMSQIISQGSAYLQKNIWVIIFPEGTRYSWPTIGKMSRGAAILACKAETVILPIFHNSGEMSYKNSWIKKPGLIKVTIGAPVITKEKDSSAVNRELEQWMAETLNKYKK